MEAEEQGRGWRAREVSARGSAEREDKTAERMRKECQNYRLKQYCKIFIQASGIAIRHKKCGK